MLSNVKEICKKCKWFDPTCGVGCSEEDCAGCVQCDDFNNWLSVNYTKFQFCIIIKKYLFLF